MTDFELLQEPLLSRGALDRPVTLRSDGDALDAGWRDALVLRVSPRGRVRLQGDRLVLERAAHLFTQRPDEAVLLGVDEELHVWAVRDMGFDERVVPGESDGTVELGDLRSCGALLGSTEAGQYVTALAVLTWHANARFCSRDGAATKPVQAGWVRVCDSCGREEYPRTDPAIICLVHDGADRILLARQPVWPDRMYSVLAGFVEAGESLEACVGREIEEEVGVRVHDVHYLGSQPWPFPRSIMLGFEAKADPTQEFVFADGEIAEAQWFTREEVRDALETGDWSTRADAKLLLPGSVSIARGMVESWAAAGQ